MIMKVEINMGYCGTEVQCCVGFWYHVASETLDTVAHTLLYSTLGYSRGNLTCTAGSKLIPPAILSG